MIRQYHTDVHGWTSIKNNKDHVTLRNIINQYSEELPSKFDASGDAVSFHVGSGSGEIIYFNVINDIVDKEDESCMRSEYLFRVWNFKKNWIWKVVCEYGESYGEEVYYKQMKHECDVVAKINIEELWKNGNLTKIYDEDCYEFMLRDINYVGHMKKISFLIHVSKNTSMIEFVKDSKNDNVQEKVNPKPVNICYTGRLKGEIKKEITDKIMKKKIAKRRGPCGSEIHIDTCMGVVQIFGNHSNYRRITCKAFVSKKQAESVIEYLCFMV